jgi:RimJ/RimL family protein N-acetyltransferase
MELIPLAQNYRRYVCRGAFVDVCVPEPSDYSFLIGLRNRESVRRWFLDSRPIDQDAGTKWLAARASRDDDVLLLIRHRTRSMNVGSIGWHNLDENTGLAELGRLALDPSALRTLARFGEPRSAMQNLALDACLALRDYVFSHFGILTIKTCYKSGNIAAAEINQACGMRICETPANSEANLIYLQLTRSEWEQLLQSTP